MSTLVDLEELAAVSVDILVVDDVASDVRLLSEILEAAGYAVRPASDGELALRSARAKPPALVLLDIRLPGLDGLEVCRRLKADPLTTEVPVLFISALYDDRDKGRAFEAGGSDYITKPLHKEEVLARVQTHLASSRSRALLARERDRARGYLDLAGVIMVALDRAGNVSMINRKGCCVLGYEEAEILGQPWFERFVPSDAHEVVLEAFRQIVLGNLELHEYYENPVLTKRGDQRLIAWHNALIRDAAGTITGTLSSGEDITERKAAEAERQSLMASLAQSSRLASMGMLAAGVAHEINNPLAYVLYNLECLVDDFPKLLRALHLAMARLRDRIGPEALDELMGEVGDLMRPALVDDLQASFRDALEGTRRIQGVARGLSTFSRVEKDRLVPVNLGHVIDVAGSMLTNEIKYRARLVKEHGKIPAVMASEGRLSQVFLNLILNAVHAIDEGQASSNEIRVKTWSEGDAVFAEVRDTGCGIPAEDLGEVFEPFFTTREIGVGSGLGLSISKNIVETFGGTIDVQSEVGRGTCFTVRLPIRRVETAPVEAASRGDDDGEAEAANAPQLRGRILIIDDEAAIRSIMVRLLAHDTVQAASGAEAKQILEGDQAFDLILCDVMMSDLSGVDLHEWLAAAHPSLAKRLIFVTGGAFTPRARDYLSQVDNLQIEKPFDAVSFRKIVTSKLNSSE